MIFLFTFFQINSKYNTFSILLSNFTLIKIQSFFCSLLPNKDSGAVPEVWVVPKLLAPPPDTGGNLKKKYPHLSVSSI